MEEMEEKDRLYEITTYFANNCPHVTEMCISLRYHDWCEFEKTEIYRQLVRYLDDLKAQDNH